MFSGSPVLLQCADIRTIWPLHIRSRCSCSADFHHLWLRPPVRFWTRTSAGGNRTAHYWKVNNKHVRTIKKIALDVFIAGYLIQFRRMRSTICCTPSQICIYRPWGGLSQALLLSWVVSMEPINIDFATTGCPTIEFSLCFCYFVGFYSS